MYAAYVRVSKVGKRDRDSLRSPDMQRQRIDLFAQQEDLEVAWFQPDLDVSGAKGEREELNRIVTGIQDGTYEGLVVAKLDRLSRLAPKQQVDLFDRIDGESKFTRILSASEPNGTRQSDGRWKLDKESRLIRNMFLDIARYMWEGAQEQFAETAANAVARGIHPNAPFGYFKDNGHPLQVKDSEARVVLELFKMRATGKGRQAMANWANDEQDIKPQRGKRWIGSTVDKITHNRVYLGEARYGETVCKNAHSAIVPLELFEAAQLARGIKTRRSDEPALVAGIVYCASCGHKMSASSVGKPKVFVYRCRKHHGDVVCNEPVTVVRKPLDEYVEKKFRWHYSKEGPDKKNVAVEGGVNNANLTELIHCAEAAEADLREYNRNTRLQDLLGDEFEAGIEARASKVQDAKRELDAARRQYIGVDFSAVTLEGVWDTLLPMDKKQLLSNGIDRIIVSAAARERIKINEKWVTRRKPTNALDTDRIDIIFTR